MTTTQTLLPRPDVRPAASLEAEICDRCCAPAQVHVVVGSGRELMLCCHHAREHEAELRRSGALMLVGARSARLWW